MQLTITPYDPTRPHPTAPARGARKVTKADADLPDGIARSLWVGTAGTANLVDATGSLCTSFPLVQGPNPIAVSQVKLGGTADDIWALY